MKKDVAATPKAKPVKKSEVTAEIKGRELTGKVASTKMKDSIVVVIERFILHPIYKKPVRRTNRLAVHAPGHTVKTGDVVTIKEIKPVSKTKHFMLVQKA